MAGNGGRFTGRAVDVHAMTPSFTEKLNTMAFEVTDQIDPFHEIEASGSRITILFRRDSSANARLDSNTSWTASLTFVRASSILSPCVFAPGNSSTNATYPSGTCWNTAVSCSFIAVVSLHVKYNRVHSLCPLSARRRGGGRAVRATPVLPERAR